MPKITIRTKDSTGKITEKVMEVSEERAKRIKQFFIDLTEQKRKKHEYLRQKVKELGLEKKLLEQNKNLKK